MNKPNPLTKEYVKYLLLLSGEDQIEVAKTFSPEEKKEIKQLIPVVKDTMFSREDKLQFILKHAQVVSKPTLVKEKNT